MSTIATSQTTAAPGTALREARPSFLGCVGAEVLKLSRQGMVWAMLSVALLFFGLIALALPTAGNLKTLLEQHPATYVFNLIDVYLAMFDSGSGIFLILVSARLVGMEYSSGTIRVLLARGTGRLRLLLAKLTALALLGLMLLGGFIVLVSVSMYATVVSWEGSFSKITTLPGTVWTDLGINALIALASLGVCILIGATAAVLGRSVAFGVGAGLALFPLDNFGTILLGFLNALTKWHVWLDVSDYLLGPNLNRLPVLMQTDHPAHSAFATPLVATTATHDWLVIAAWVVGLVVVSFGLTWRRDVLQ